MPATNRSIRGRSLAALLFAAALIAVAALFAPAAASADPGGGSATQFTASYDLFGPRVASVHLDCSGVRIANANMGMVKDTETCLLTGDTSSLVAGTYKGDPVGSSPLVSGLAGWGSDFDGAIATRWTSTFVNNGNGSWTLEEVAYY